MEQSHQWLPMCQKKLILLFPACDEVVSHPLNAWKNGSGKDLSNLRLRAIW